VARASRARGSSSERSQLLWLGAGLAVIGTGFGCAFGRWTFPAILLGLAALALVGALADRRVGRSVFLVFTLVSLTVGRLVSWLVVLVLYVLAIGVFGSILKLFGMNRLERDFAANKRKATMFVDVPPLDRASFRRQS
jgi:fatty acid desaturase